MKQENLLVRSLSLAAIRERDSELPYNKMYIVTESIHSSSPSA